MFPNARFSLFFSSLFFLSFFSRSAVYSERWWSPLPEIPCLYVRGGKRESNGNSIIIIARLLSVEKLCGGARVAAVPAINSGPSHGYTALRRAQIGQGSTARRMCAFIRGEPRLIIRLKNRRPLAKRRIPSLSFSPEYLSR